MFEIAPHYDATIGQANRRADGEAAIGRIGILHGVPRGGQQLVFPAGHGRTTSHSTGCSIPLVRWLFDAVHITQGRLASSGCNKFRSSHNVRLMPSTML